MIVTIERQTLTVHNCVPQVWDAVQHINPVQFPIDVVQASATPPLTVLNSAFVKFETACFFNCSLPLTGFGFMFVGFDF
jgi:hypothetical protein